MFFCNTHGQFFFTVIVINRNRKRISNVCIKTPEAAEFEKNCWYTSIAIYCETFPYSLRNFIWIQCSACQWRSSNLCMDYNDWNYFFPQCWLLAPNSNVLSNTFVSWNRSTHIIRVSMEIDRFLILWWCMKMQMKIFSRWSITIRFKTNFVIIHRNEVFFL